MSPGKRASDDRASSDDRGSITAETAAALPAVVFVVAVMLWGVQVAEARLSCVDAARAGARAAARGERLSAVRAAVAGAAPSGAVVELSRDARLTTVMVRTAVRPAWASGLPPITVEGRAVTTTEPEVREVPDVP